MDLEGTVDDPDLYWWLAYEWANLYPACSGCARAKSTRFPVRGERAAPEARGPELEREHRLVLDPAGRAGGRASLSPRRQRHGATERGAATIECVALNRRDLERPAGSRRRLWQRSRRSTRPSQRRRQALAPSARSVTALRRRLIAEHLGEAVRPRRTVEPHARGSVWLDRIDILNFRASEPRARVPRAPPEADAAVALLLGRQRRRQELGPASDRVALMPRPRAPAIHRRRVSARDAPGPRAGRPRSASSSATARRVRLGFRAGQPRLHARGTAAAAERLRLREHPAAAGARARDRRPRRTSIGSTTSSTPAIRLVAPRTGWRQVDGVAEQDVHLPRELAARRSWSSRRTTGSCARRGTLRIRRQATLPLADYSDGYRSIVAFTADLMLNLSDRWDSIRTAERARARRRARGAPASDLAHDGGRQAAEGLPAPPLRGDDATTRCACAAAGPARCTCCSGTTTRTRWRRGSATSRPASPPTSCSPARGSACRRRSTRGTTALMQEHSRLLLASRARRQATPSGELRSRRSSAAPGTFAETSDERLVRSVVAELRGAEQELTGASARPPGRPCSSACGLDGTPADDALPPPEAPGHVRGRGAGDSATRSGGGRRPAAAGVRPVLERLQAGVRRPRSAASAATARSRSSAVRTATSSTTRRSPSWPGSGWTRRPGARVAEQLARARAAAGAALRPRLLVARIQLVELPARLRRLQPEVEEDDLPSHASRPGRTVPPSADVTERALLLNPFNGPAPGKHLRFPPTDRSCTRGRAAGTASRRSRPSASTARASASCGSRSCSDAYQALREFADAGLRERCRGREAGVARHRPAGQAERQFAGAVRTIVEHALGVRWDEVEAAAP